MIKNFATTDKCCEREDFFSQEQEPIAFNSKNSKFRLYRLKKTGQIICEFNLKLGLGGEKIEIAQITDVHLNYCFSEAQEDSEVLYTKQCRKWLAEGESVKSIDKAMEAARFFDQTVITGDILDYLSLGAMELTKKHIFERDSEIICTLGGHDITKQMETGKADRLSLEERLHILENFWIHDIYYFSKTVKEKIIAVGLNNGTGRYFPKQVESLRHDIERARKENKFILIFQHEPISTGNLKDTAIEPILIAGSNNKQRNFYSCIGSAEETDDTTKQMYRLICDSADVIKGIFCGHYHSAFYTEVNAFIGEKKAYIPQVIVPANPYFSHVGVVTRIIVE